MIRTFTQFFKADGGAGVRQNWRKNALTLLALITCGLVSFEANAQVTVTNPTNTTPNLSATYPSLANAITALNATTAISGPVTITLTGNETAPVGGYSITAIPTGASSVNSITIEGSSSTITANGTLTGGALTDAIFKLVGADFITIQNFTMLENAANTVTAAGSNNMTEWGVALLYATTTNGAQNNTIKNNTITLNRTYQNTFGIYANSTHTATTITTTASATTAAGGNSGLKVYGNTISNVNNGIVVVGPTAVADYNTGIDIGGSSLSQANTITNFGTTNAISGYANVSGTVNGILVRNSVGLNISYNTITSSAGGVTAGTLNGIHIPAASTAPTATFTNNINYNTIALQSGVSTAINGITYPSGSASATSVLNVNNNNFTQLNHSVTASAAIIAISIVSTNLTTSVSNNTFTNLTTNTTGNFTFISHNYSMPASGSQTLSNNSIVTAFNKTGAGGTVTISTTGGSSPNTASASYINNNFSNITVTGATGITGFNNTDGAGSSPSKTITGNTFSNWTGGTSAITGMTYTYWGGGVTNTLSNNTITNITGQAAITAISIGSSFAGTNTVTLSNNTISNLSSTGTGGLVQGILCASTCSVININNNTISGLSSTSATTNLNGIQLTGATQTNVFKNTICGLSISGAITTQYANGILLSNSLTAVNIHNNMIGDLQAPNANDANALNGINVNTSGATNAINVYYNTVYLNASSTGALFGSSACSASSVPIVKLNNNNFINLSSSNGAGVAVAYRRSTATLTNYDAASDRNNFVASTIYTDGTTPLTTIAAYKALVATRDANAFSEAPTFLSTTCGNSNFLKIDNTIATQLESGAANIAGLTDDFENTVRQGNPGYLSQVNGGGTAPDIGADEFDGIPAFPMSLVSADAEQTTNGSCVGGTNIKVLKMSIVTTGSLSPLTLNDITIDPNGTTVLGDITNFRIYYTGTSGTFSTAVPIMASTPIISGSNMVTLGSPLTLVQGTNYFWLTYDINSTTSGAEVDGEFTAFTLSSGPGAITTSAPTGVNTIYSSPTITIGATPLNAAICGGTGNVVLAASGATTYAWSPATGLSSATSASPTATPSATTIYTVTGTDANGCISTATQQVGVGPAVTMSSVTATPATICQGSTSQLLATASINGTPNTYSFAASSGTFTPLSNPIVITGGAADSYFSGTLPIGFNFKYNGTTYSNFYFSSNGFIAMTTTVGTGTANALATAGSPVIAPLWDDLDGSGSGSGVASYKLSGTPGNYVLTVEWLNWEWNYQASASVISFQCKLYEADNHIEFIYRQETGTATSPSASIGISGAVGNYLSLNGTSTSPTASSSAETTTLSTKPATGQIYSFMPPTASTYLWTPATDLSASNIPNPVAGPLSTTITYGVVATSSVGCIATGTVAVTVDPLVGTAATTTPACDYKNFTVTANHTGGGAPFTYAWDDGLGNTYPNAKTITTNLPAGLYTFTCTVSDACGGNVTSAVTFTVNANPTVAINPTPLNAAICGGSPANVTLAATGAATYAWSPSTNLSATTGASVSANPSSTRTYTVIGTDANGCTASASQQVGVATAVVVTTPTATPASICSGTNSQLNVTATQAVDKSPKGYLFAGSTGTYSVITGISLTTSSTDDDGVGNLPIGFAFNYNGVNHTVFGMRTNGLIELSQASTAALSAFSSNALASTANCIAPLWDDNNTAGGTMIYATTGTSPNRILTAQWTGLHVAGGGSSTNPTIDMQIKLYETTNKIEFIYGSTSAALSSPTASIGLSGAVGNFLSVTPLSPASASTVSSTTENASIASAANFPSGTIYTFTPQADAVFTYAWTPTATLVPVAGNIANPVATAVTNTTAYSVTVTGLAGCQGTGNVTVSTEPLACNALTTGGATPCVGIQTVTAAPTGGGLPYAYAWTEDGTPMAATTATISPTAGTHTYICTVTDACATSCTTAGLVVTTNANPTVTASATATTYCAPGTAVTISTGGTSGLSYAWSPATGLSVTTGASVNATPSAPTTYTVTGTDANGCIGTATTAIGSGSTVVMGTATATPATVCNGSNSVLAATATLSPGNTTTASYCLPTVLGYPGAGGDYLKDFSFAGIVNNGTTDEPTDYTYYSALTANVIANGTTSYPVSLTAGGTSSTYAQQFRIWIDYNQNGTFETTESVFNTTASTFSPTSATGNIIVPTTAYNGITRMRVLSKYSSTPANTEACTTSASSYGEYEDYNVTITGGVNPPLTGGTFVWSPATFLSSTSGASVTATAATASTTYTVTATSAAGCSASTTVGVTVNPLPTASISGGTTVCQNATSPVITFTGAAGTAPYTFTYKIGTSGNLTVSTTGGSSSVTVAAPTTVSGTFTYSLVSVADANTCSQTQTGSTIVTVNPLPTAVVSGGGAVCAGATLPNVSIALTGTGPWNLTYTDGITPTTVTATSTNPYIITAASVGTYTVTAVSDANCTGTSMTGSATVTVNPLPTATITTNNGPICANNDASFALGGTTNAVVTYNFGSSNMTTTLASGASMLTVPAATSSQTLTLVSVTNGTCSQTLSETSTVTVNALPAVPVITASAATTFCSGNTVNLTSSYTGAGNVWSNAATTDAITVSTSGNYTVTYTDGNGCSSTSAVSPVAVLSSASATVPTVAGGYVATNFCIEGSGATAWTYFYSNDKLLLGLQMNSWNPGTLVQATPGAGEYQVRVDVAGGTGLPVVDLTSATYNLINGKPWKVINRTWDVKLYEQAQEPLLANQPINVKTYFTEAEYTAVNNAFTVLADKLTSPSQMTVYKLYRTTPLWLGAYATSMDALTALHAGLDSTDLILYNNQSSYLADWAYTPNQPYTGVHTAEIAVTEFSGGGGGGGAAGSAPFSVELAYFDGQNQGSYNLLNWVTISELSNRLFEVQRSIDGISFQTIGTVNTKAVNGTSSNAISYEFADLKPAKNSYYRLKQIDIDGSVNMLPKVVEISLADNFKTAINLFPNPATSELNVAITGNTFDTYLVEVSDIYGRAVASTQQLSNGGTTISTINVKDLAQGTYIVTVKDRTNSIVSTQRFIKE